LRSFPVPCRDKAAPFPGHLFLFPPKNPPRPLTLSLHSSLYFLFLFFFSIVLPFSNLRFLLFGGNFPGMSLFFFSFFSVKLETFYSTQDPPSIPPTSKCNLSRCPLSPPNPMLVSDDTCPLQHVSPPVDFAFSSSLRSFVFSMSVPHPNRQLLFPLANPPLPEFSFYCIVKVPLPQSLLLLVPDYVIVCPNL